MYDVARKFGFGINVSYSVGYLIRRRCFRRL